MKAENWIDNAALCELISLGFRLPTIELAQAVTSGEFAATLTDLGSACELDTEQVSLAVEKIVLHEGADADELFHTLRIDYTALYTSRPSSKVSPYGSIWWAEDHDLHPVLFVNSRAMAVERYLRQFGLGQAEGKNDPLDSIPTMFEFLQYCSLVVGGALEPVNDVAMTAEAYQDFIEEYLSDWAVRFADATIEAAEQPFYLGMSILLKAFMAKV
jgi:TorA maturation chaperone TorD